MFSNSNEFHSRCHSNSSNFRHGRSTAQLCLSKILRIISSFPSDSTSIRANTASQTSELEEFRVSGEGMNFSPGNKNNGIDLNVEFGSSPEDEAEVVASPAVAYVDGKVSSVQSNSENFGGLKSDLDGNGLLFTGDNEKSSEVECEVKELAKSKGVDSTDSDRIEIEEEEEEESDALEFEENKASAEESLEIGNNGVFGEDETKIGGIREDDGCLSMLIDAARMILGSEFSDGGELAAAAVGNQNRSPNELVLNNEVQPSDRRRSKRTAEIDGEWADTTPVLRSKRGRARMLPCKYRDSVLEPLTALCRQKSGTVSVRRRSR